MDFSFSALTIPLILVGFLVGTYSSVAGGGAIVLVPLFNLAGIPLPAAIATMRACAMVHQGFSAATFWSRGAIKWQSALWAVLWTVPGAFVGSRLVTSLDTRLLSYVVAACLVAVYFALPAARKKKGAKRLRRRADNWFLLTAVGTLALSVYGGLYGAGFGTFLMLMFWWIGGMDMLQASADASVAGFAAAIVSTWVFTGSGLIHWDIFWPVAVGGAFGSILGVELAAHYGMGWIRALLQGVIALTVLKLVFIPG